MDALTDPQAIQALRFMHAELTGDALGRLAAYQDAHDSGRLDEFVRALTGLAIHYGRLAHGEPQLRQHLETAIAASQPPSDTDPGALESRSPDPSGPAGRGSLSDDDFHGDAPMTQPNGMTLTVDLSRFSDTNLRHACALVHAAATTLCERQLVVGDVLLAISAGLAEARIDRATTLDALARSADDDGEATGALLSDVDDLFEGWTPDE